MRRSEREQAARTAEGHLAAEAEGLYAAWEIGEDVGDERDDLGQRAQSCESSGLDRKVGGRTCTIAPMREPKYE